MPFDVGEGERIGQGGIGTARGGGGRESGIEGGDDQLWAMQMGANANHVCVVERQVLLGIGVIAECGADFAEPDASLSTPLPPPSHHDDSFEAPGNAGAVYAMRCLQAVPRSPWRSLQPPRPCLAISGHSPTLSTPPSDVVRSPGGPLCRTYHISVDPHRWIVSATLCMCIDLQRAVAKSARSQVPGPSPAPPMLRRATEVTFECEALQTPLLILPFPLRQRRSFVTFLAQNAVSHKRCGIGLRMGGCYESTPLFCPPVLVRMLALEAHGIYAGPSIHFCFGTKKLTLCGHP
ncbi:uncharacterized protein SEPMUDRAFT_115595 [Sphaerulina musiva SO2202]|uniref:Uncharacterized protein n=1 Tax=Sphaerulina musiva (strain SO2202) TaxID=692275 RepID=M3D8U3_SPHMS|nr:uncharacterized protein SEPMUDRAFT_115595 [Sphaerulina musiva SO2202]EMF14314.1 hypothetical protein SEPMUDRAFT_115595 [Sphaerulina musiva SO2202]